MLVEGRLERFASSGGAIDVLVSSVTALEPGRPEAESKDFSLLDQRELERLRAEREAAAAEADFRAVAPAVMSFASGRRR